MASSLIALFFIPSLVLGFNSNTLRLRQWRRFASTEQKTDPLAATEPPNPVVRLLHTNWWPLATVNSLSQDRPNPLQVLGKPLVAFKAATNDDDWTVLDDRCGHRFAPLSEGRVVKCAEGCSNIQCAYHGWEFDKDGVCVKLPQEPTKVEKARPVLHYPTQVRAGILWAWTDPNTYQSLGKETTIPISSVLEEFIDYYGPDSCFMRDLPYGMEILGENLLDVSHLPFSHHGTGALRRELGGELPMRMLSDAEKQEHADWEMQYNKIKESGGSFPADAGKHDHIVEHVHKMEKIELGDHEDGSDVTSVLLPTFLARILEAGKHDPIFRGFQSYSGRKSDDTWECTCAFYEPNHIRYRRLRGGRAPAQQELFMCPVAPGKSRVFLFNARASIAPSSAASSEAFPLKSLLQPKAWKKRVRSALIAYLFDPRRVSSHMVYNNIFDGDGVFLHKQGRHMAQAGLTFRDYSSPGSSDVLLNAYRRYIARAAQETGQAGHRGSAEAVTGATPEAYETSDALSTSRQTMLDRYSSHTAHCPACQQALHWWTRSAEVSGAAATSLLGAAGAGTVFSLICARLISQGLVQPKWLARSVVLTFSLWLLSVAMDGIRRRCQRSAQRFTFIDYVHAERN